MAWYNWLAIAIFVVTATICHVLDKYENDPSTAVIAGREISRITAATCVVMFILQGLEMLQG